MSAETQRQFREVQAHFRLPSLALVEKDLHVVRVIAALASLDAGPFRLVFGGGTALTGAHKLVRRIAGSMVSQYDGPTHCFRWRAQHGRPESVSKLNRGFDAAHI